MNAEKGEVTSAEEGHDADRRCGSTLSRTRGQPLTLVNDELLPAQGGAEDTRNKS